MDNYVMKIYALILLVLGLFACNYKTVESQQIQTNSKSETKNQIAKKPILIELFTSEG
jgi:hypothetical protein